MRKLIILFSLVLFVASCKKDSVTLVPAVVDVKPATYLNVSYGSDAVQKMDVYLPGGRTVATTKTIVIIHGGAWLDGDKADMTFVVDSITKRSPNFAMININYRLAVYGVSNLFPTQELDVKAAIDFYLTKSIEYLVSKDLIVLGASAGAHLALLHAYKNDPDKHVKAVIDFFGPTDLVAIWNQGYYQQIALMAAIGAAYTDNQAIYTQSSPINYVTAQSPPTIALQGLVDDIVLPVQSTTLVDKLNMAGVSNQLVTYPNEGHGFSDAANTDALNKILPFLAKYVK